MWAIGKWYSKYESDHNALAQHGRGNNVILSGIPESVSEDLLEESVMSILADIDVLLESQDIEACHRFGKPNWDRSLKTIVLFANRKNCKKVLFNKKKPSSIDNSKHNFTQNTKNFANENLTPMNESLPTTAESWSAVVSFMVASREMALSESNVGRKIDL